MKNSVNILSSFLVFCCLSITEIVFSEACMAAEGFNYQVLSAVLSAEEKEWLRSHKKVRIGVDDAYAPYSFKNSAGEYTGLAIDYFRLLGKALDVSFEIVPDLSWTEILHAAEQKRLDVIVTAVSTRERKNYLLFTDEYLPTPLVIMTRANTTKIVSGKDLEGKIVALVKGYSSTEKIKQEIKNIIQYPVDTIEQGLRAVATGQADALVGVSGAVTYQAQKTGIFNLKVAGEYHSKNNAQRIGVRKDWPVLISILNKALGAIPEAVHIDLTNKWLPLTQKPRILRPATLEFRLTPEEKRWLNTSPVVRIAIDSEWAPVEFIDKQGGYSGISRDYILNIEKKLGVKFEIVNSSGWSSAIKMIEEGDVDLLPGVAITEQRKTKLSFTDSYLTLPVMIFADQKVDYIYKLSELSEKRVAVVKDYAVEEILKLNHPELDLVRVESITEGLSKVVNGEVNAYIGNMVSTGYYLEKLGYSQLKIVGETPYHLKVAVGVNKDKVMLLSVINKAITSISDEWRSAIYRRWVSVKYERGFDYDLFWKILAFVILVLIVFAYWNRRLKKEVVLRTALQHEADEAREKIQRVMHDMARVNKDLQAANIKLRDLDRLKSMFIASVSHELRTPLNSIIGFSEMMKMESFGKLEGKYLDYVNRINQSGQHLLGLITDIIDISKIESGRIDVHSEDFMLDKVIFEAVDIIRKQADDKGLGLNIEVENNVTVHTDKRRLLQCVINFMSNAMKFTEQGEVTVSARVEKNNILIEVKDTGIGISDSEKGRMFEPFERIDSHLHIKAGGTGLGLYLTKKIAEDLLSGTVGMESEEGKGSCFWLKVKADLDR